MAPALAVELKDEKTRLSAAAPSTRVNMVPPEIHSPCTRESDSDDQRKLNRTDAREELSINCGGGTADSPSQPGARFRRT
jgi:hypothetical protein